MRTAGRTVLIAGTTVIIGMLGLLVLRQSLLNGVAIAAAATVAMIVLGSLTLLPALLGFTGTRLARPSRLNPLPRGQVFGRARSQARRGAQAAVRPSSAGPAERWAAVIQRHPAVAAVPSAALILVLAAPALGMKLSMPDESARPAGPWGTRATPPWPGGSGPGSTHR